jgi:hypothetical protein
MCSGADIHRCWCNRSGGCAEVAKKTRTQAVDAGAVAMVLIPDLCSPSTRPQPRRAQWRTVVPTSGSSRAATGHPTGAFACSKADPRCKKVLEQQVPTSSDQRPAPERELSTRYCLSPRTALSPTRANRNCDNRDARRHSRQFQTALAIDRKAKRICQEHRLQRHRTQSCQYNHSTGLKDSLRILVAISSMAKKL